MSDAFNVAKQFFNACEAPLGWQGCQEYVASGATFSAQSEPIAEITSVEGYCEWMHGFGTVTAKGATYTLHTQAWDADNNTALFYATYHATHVGEGGPVPPTGEATNSDYVYAIKMNDENKVQHMTKIWNAPWAMNELGWM